MGRLLSDVTKKTKNNILTGYFFIPDSLEYVYPLLRLSISTLKSICLILCPEIEDRRAYCFCPVCHSVILSETLTLLITFEQWMLELWYFTWLSLVIRPFRGYHYFLPGDLDLGVWPILKKSTLLITIEQWVLELWYFTWVFLVIRPFCGYHFIWPCDLDLGLWPIFLKTLTLLITIEQWVLELWYFTWISLVIRPFRGNHYFFTLLPWPKSLTYFFKT